MKDYLNCLSSKVDVLCLHDHILRGDNVVRNMRMLWRRDNFSSLEASPSNEVEDIRIGVGLGEVVLTCVPIVDCNM